MLIVDVVGTLIIAILSMSFIGAIFAIPAALPFIRPYATYHQRFRVTLIAICSLAAWLIPLHGLSYFGGKLGVTFACVGSNGFDNFCSLPVEYDLRGEFEHEIGMRSMMPPPLREHCFTGNSEVCEAADTWYLPKTSWIGYLGTWLIMSYTGIVTATLAWAVTKKRSPQKEKRKNEDLE